jgi:hypothetical protein
MAVASAMKRPHRNSGIRPRTEHEKDETRDRPLIDHVDAAIKGGLAK